MAPNHSLEPTAAAGRLSSNVRRYVTRRAISADGTSIVYAARGSGSPALVFVHGWSCNRTYWAAQLPALSKSNLVVALDLAGHGESGCTRQDWNIAAFGADVTAVVADLALDAVVLVGHSMGGDVILEASRRLGSRVRALILVDQHYQLSRFMTEAQVRQRVAPFRANFVETVYAFVCTLFPAYADPALVERIANQMSSAPQQVALGALEATWNYARGVPAVLSELRVPVVALNAERSATDIESMRRHGVNVVLMPRTGHFPMMERPREFNALFRHVLEGFVRRTL